MFTPDKKLLAEIDRIAGEVFELSLWLTDHPEISGEEKESSAAVIAFLKKHGYRVETPYGGVDYSFRAVPEGADPALPRIAVLCEYDALPDIGHGCGHSLSCGVSILTALALRSAVPDLAAVIELVGTPAEETGGGKVIMSENGAFNGYILAIMSHLDSDNVPQSRILASNDMYVTFFGKTAHASANPWDGVNAWNAAQLFSHAADMMRQHLTPDCQLHGIVINGGAAPNIVPDKVEIEYYLRSATISGLAALWEKLETCAKGAALATGCTYTAVQRYPTYADLFYPQSAEEVFIEIYRAFGYKYRIEEKPAGSSDVGNVDLVTPTLAPYISATDHFISLHTAEFTAALRGERGMRTLIEGTRIQASLLLEAVRRPGLLDRITAEHKAYRDSQKTGSRP
jgi:amidohydrolase